MAKKELAKLEQAQAENAEVKASENGVLRESSVTAGE